MAKMSIERFREIKKRMDEIFELFVKDDNDEIKLSDEDSDKIEAEIQQMSDEINGSDLSEISFEEYADFKFFGMINFSGTRANIDFSLIDAENIDSSVRVKGCNIKNFDFDTMEYDDESFDEDFMSKYPDRFLPHGKYPKDVTWRFYLKSLTVQDIIKYDLYDEIANGRCDFKAQSIFKKIKPDVARIIPAEICDSFYLGESIFRKILSSEDELTIESIEKIITQAIEEQLKKDYILIDEYRKIMYSPNVSKFIPDEMKLDFGDSHDLEEKYVRGDLSIQDIFENMDIFKNKKFIYKMHNHIFNDNEFEGVTEEKIFYLFENFPDISEVLSVSKSAICSLSRSMDIEKSKEENVQGVRKFVEEFLNDERAEYFDLDQLLILEKYYSFEKLKEGLEEYKKNKIDRILTYTTEEKIASYGISKALFKSYDILYLFENYGFETVMEFDKANGNVFSKNNFELGKKMYDYYFHYSGNNYDPKTMIRYRENQPEDNFEPFSMEDFEECVRRMIYTTPTDTKIPQPIDYRNFSQHFKQRFPKMFLSEDAPQELQDKYYTKTLKIEDLAQHKDWMDFLEGKDYKLGMQFPEVKLIHNSDHKSIDLIDSLKKLTDSKKDIFNFLIDNEKILNLIHLKQSSIHISYEMMESLDDFRECLEGEIEREILSGAMPYGEPYIPDFFRKKHPELVLDENAPKELKEKFYPLSYNGSTEEYESHYDNFTVHDLIKDEYQEFLEGKSFALMQNETLKKILQMFEIQEIRTLCQLDSSAMDVYSMNLRNINTLKQKLSVYPEQYAKEELMEGEKLDAEQFEEMLKDDEFRSRFEKLKQDYYEYIVKNPGFLLYLEPEKHSKEMLKKYNVLSSANMLHASTSFSRDSYEQILGHMIEFLGYEETQKLLEVPEIDEETLSRIYERDEVIKSLYEKKFEITGNLKVISKLFEGFPSLMPTQEKITSKPTCKLFASLNKKMQDGFDKDIKSLIIEILRENDVEIDDEKIEELIQNVIKISTSQKLDLVRENNSTTIDTSIEENQKTKNMIKMHYRNALEYSLNKSEKIDINLVREYLEKEFGRLNENGEPYYSPHVTDHLEELIQFAEELNLNPEWNKKLNHTIVDDLMEESGKIGKGWIRKITSNLCYKHEKLTFEELDTLDKLVYPEESDLEIDSIATVGLKELSKAEKEKVYKLLTTDDYRGLFTYGKAEKMFSALQLPYSEAFRQYFLKHKEEFISNPDLYTKFSIMASKFDSYLEEPGIHTRYLEGKLTPEDILVKISKEAYPNIAIDKGEHEVIYQITQNGAKLSESQAIIALKLFKDMKKREYQVIPQEKFETKSYRGRIVRMDDPLHFAIGEITNCCQTVGEHQPGETSMIHSATERNGALFVVEELDERGRAIGIVAQSWTWRNGNRVCFDNVEIPDATKIQLGKIGGFDEIIEVYKETAKRMIETDRIKLKRLLEKGKITQKQYQSMLIKDVGMGLGCDDLIKNVSSEERSKFPNLEIVSPLEFGRTYTGEGSRTLYSDSLVIAILIAHNDDFAPDDHIHANIEVGDYGVHYIKTRDIFRRMGFDIDPDKIDTISAMVQKNDRADSAFTNNPLNVSEVACNVGIYDLGASDADRLKISMSESGDWYTLYEEKADEIVIHESGIDTSNPEGELDIFDRKMAIAEYTSEIYQMMYDAMMKEKAMRIDNFSLDKFINLENLVNSGVISIENGVVKVLDGEKLKKTIENYNKQIDIQRRERLTLNVEFKPEEIEGEEIE